ncbi:arginine N-succinyltransferase [Crenobacter caeni]|uniref:Arginine N-succinyltransferase n=1 Tax=Crenobacter caeni TaxID=2705474 RepID=A0A6B2KQA4_9NEIS|nr:arginine N-succinyltransferase [Crenobacter caeni]NDV12320.1 arginine N-succinyltransferase [Crenobacter caeni]
MLTVRPATIGDLPALEAMAVASGVGVTSLPANREKLYDKLRRSEAAFEQEGADSDYYMFVLEREGAVVGTAAIAAQAGFDEPFYSYRSETLVHASRSLGVNNRIHALTMCHDLTGLVQLCGFYCERAFAAEAAELLSRARLLFIASERARFGRRAIAEMLGVHDVAGQSPFWDAIGRRFFNMDFNEVERAFAEHSKTFVAELMPAYPIYVPLLPDAAQAAIGQVHPDFEQPCRILGAEGFEADQYLDIFDGGAVLTADIDSLLTVRGATALPLGVTASLPEGATPTLLGAGERAAFRSTVGRAFVSDGKVWVDPDTAQVLGAVDGQTVRAVAQLGL